MVMTKEIILTLFLVIIIVKKITRRSKEVKSTHKEIISDNLTDDMTEYSRKISYELGFKHESFKRPQVLKRKGLMEEENSYLERCKMVDSKFAEAMKNLIPLRVLYTEETLRNKTLMVFIDTVDDTKVIARDHSAVLEIDLKTVYGGIAGEFVLINLDKEGENLKINYVLADINKAKN